MPYGAVLEMRYSLQREIDVENMIQTDLTKVFRVVFDPIS